MKGRFCCLFGVFMFWFSLCAESQHVDDLYNLDFRYEGVKAIHWTLGDFERWKGGNKVDTMELKEGKQVFGLTSARLFKDWEYANFRGKLAQQLYIPTACRQLRFELDVKGVNLSEAWMKVVRLDAEEKCLGMDSVLIQSDGEWRLCTMDVVTGGACFFRVEIYGKGWDGEGRYSKLLLDNLRIEGDGREISHVDLSLPQTGDFQFADSWQDGFDSQVRGKKVVVLAETVKGDSVSVRMEKGLVLRGVEQGDCKLLLLDMAFDCAMLFDLYIQGNERIKKELLVSIAEKMALPPRLCLEVLEDLRAYNEGHEGKVVIAGTKVLGVYPYLMDGFQAISAERESDVRRRLLVSLGEGKFAKARRILNSVRMSPHWDKLAVDKLSGIVALESEWQQNEWGRVDENEERRAEITKWCIDSLLPQGKQAILVGDWKNWNTKDNCGGNWEKSSGSYLREYYGDSCLSIAILRGKGDMMGMDLSTKKEKMWRVEVPQEPWSLEHFCTQQEGKVLFASCLAKERVAWIRYCLGVVGCEWSFPINLSERMDAFLWIR